MNFCRLHRCRHFFLSSAFATKSIREDAGCCPEMLSRNTSSSHECLLSCSTCATHTPLELAALCAIATWHYILPAMLHWCHAHSNFYRTIVSERTDGTVLLDAITTKSQIPFPTPNVRWYSTVCFVFANISAISCSRSCLTLRLVF